MYVYIYIYIYIYPLTGFCMMGTLLFKGLKRFFFMCRNGIYSFTPT